MLLSVGWFCHLVSTRLRGDQIPHLALLTCEVEGAPCWLVRGGSSCSVHMDTALEVEVLTPHCVFICTSPSAQRKGILLFARWGCKSSLPCSLLTPQEWRGSLPSSRKESPSLLTSSLLEWWAPCLMRLDISTHTQPLLAGMEMELPFFCIFWFQCGNWLKVFCPAKLPLSNFMQITTWHSVPFLLQD